MKLKKPLTYISLFSSAGVGCYGFKSENFYCVATVEILEKRLNIQRHNSKCIYDSAYISDDITTIEAKNKIRTELLKWNFKEKSKRISTSIPNAKFVGINPKSCGEI